MSEAGRPSRKYRRIGAASQPYLLAGTIALAVRSCFSYA
jgi:hypothetical protein